MGGYSLVQLSRYLKHFLSGYQSLFQEPSSPLEKGSPADHPGYQEETPPISVAIYSAS